MYFYAANLRFGSDSIIPAIHIYMKLEWGTN